MKIIILYASNSGGTFLAGKTIKDALPKKHKIEVKKINEIRVKELENYDLIILGTPSWTFGTQQGFPHQDFLSFMSENEDLILPRKKFAIFGCGDSDYAYFCGGVDHLEDFVKQIQGKLIIDSLKIDDYFFRQKENTRLIQGWVNKISESA